MELGLSEEQIMLQETVRQICCDRFSFDDLRETETCADGFSHDFWTSLCELGVSGIAIPEAYGGLEMGLLETALVHEQLGNFLAPSPHFASAILVAQFLLGSNDQRTCERLLPEIAAGSTIVTPAALEPGAGHVIETGSTIFTVDGDQLTINGTKHFVEFASVADELLVIGRDGENGGVRAAVIPANSAGVTLTRQNTLGSEPLFSVVLDDVEVSISTLISSGTPIGTLWSDAMYKGLIILAARANGAARRIHEISTAYAKEREAFGRPIGGFQAIAHYLADALVEIEGCQTLVYQAAWYHDKGEDFRRLAAIAKLQNCNMFRRVSSLGVQVHGGLGYTNDAEPQLFFRRAKQWQLLQWDDDYLLEEIAQLSSGEIAGHV